MTYDIKTTWNPGPPDVFPPHLLITPPLAICIPRLPVFPPALF